MWRQLFSNAVKSGHSLKGEAERMARIHRPAEILKRKILQRLSEDGYRICDEVLVPPDFTNKNVVRSVYTRYRKSLLQAKQLWINKWEPCLISWFANGSDVDPQRVQPILKKVVSEADRRLFQYASLLWSVPPSSGYGRRMRYLVIDRSNDKLIGLLGLCDPVLGLKARDEWIGWGTAQRLERLWHVMDAFILGAVPPYSFLLGGKLVALLATSNEVRRDFQERYAGKPALLSGKVRKPYLVLLTTTSALGRSSMLNRLKMGNRFLWKPIGWTQGQGHFRFMDGLFPDMLAYLRQIGEPLAYKYKFGGGPNWRLRVVRTCLRHMRLNPDSFLSHGIKRQIFVAELCQDAREFLRGEIQEPLFYNLPASELIGYFKERWLLPRAGRNGQFREFNSQSLRMTTRG